MIPHQDTRAAAIPAGTIHIRLFAGMAAAIGCRSLTLPWRDETAAALRGRLAVDYPTMADLLDRSAVAIDEAFVTDGTRVPRGADVAIIPPVSGG